jgi:hypothetical protein
VKKSFKKNKPGKRADKTGKMHSRTFTGKNFLNTLTAYDVQHHFFRGS